MATRRRMGTVAGAKSVCQTAGAAERSSSTPRTGIDAGRTTAGPSSIAPTSYATSNGACFQLQLFWAWLGDALYGPGASPKLLRGAASRAQRMLVLQRETGAAARVDSAAGEQQPSGVLVGASAAARVHVPRRRGDSEPDTVRRVELLDGRATPGVPDLHVRLARFDVNKI